MRKIPDRGSRSVGGLIVECGAPGAVEPEFTAPDAHVGGGGDAVAIGRARGRVRADFSLCGRLIRCRCLLLAERIASFQWEKSVGLSSAF